ncbi:MAG: hypothetical protein M1136_08285 [Chloroflexi bacterium]|nr:hypothetical protein [Chloroflexota bacterium]MCL5075630.1 hypothetical protein [Chloroflexota bacterium]
MPEWNLEELHYLRQYRTPHSEGYLIMQDEERLGRVELHFASNVVYGTLIVEREMGEDEIADLVDKIDDDLVMSADVTREDFVVSVYQGRDLGLYSDEYFEEEEEEEE